MTGLSNYRLEKVWLTPPFAVARFGASEKPLESFHWAKNDYAPRGTAETVLVPDTSFVVSDNGTISILERDKEDGENTIRFREKVGNKMVWRPACPFFELHGLISGMTGAQYPGGVYEGPLTGRLLEKLGIGLDDIVWHVRVANLKAYHYTQQEGDKVEVAISVKGDDHYRKNLDGTSPAGTSEPIVPPGRVFPLGKFQVVKPSARGRDDHQLLDVIRVRVTAPKGIIYAPKNTDKRDLSALLEPNQSVEDFTNGLSCTLNPASPWASWRVTDGDYRTQPKLLFAQEPDETSLGFLDDSCDGLIEVSIKYGGENNAFNAITRFTCCPPDFQPDRRPFVSLADDITDQQLREQVLEPEYVDDQHWDITEAEIADLMQRVRETMEASNLDHQNMRSVVTNTDQSYPFEPKPPTPGHPLPLTESGRDHHARFLAYEVFKQWCVKNPAAFNHWVRDPTDEPKVFNFQMPAMMRGSDGTPMHLTQRQYYLLQAWIKQATTELNAD